MMSTKETRALAGCADDLARHYRFKFSIGVEVDFEIHVKQIEVAGHKTVRYVCFQDGTAFSGGCPSLYNAMIALMEQITAHFGSMQKQALMRLVDLTNFIEKPLDEYLVMSLVEDEKV